MNWLIYLLIVTVIAIMALIYWGLREHYQIVLLRKRAIERTRRINSEIDMDQERLGNLLHKSLRNAMLNNSFIARNYAQTNRLECMFDIDAVFKDRNGRCVVKIDLIDLRRGENEAKSLKVITASINLRNPPGHQLPIIFGHSHRQYYPTWKFDSYLEKAVQHVKNFKLE
jgi:hypothetical protein